LRLEGGLVFHENKVKRALAQKLPSNQDIRSFDKIVDVLTRIDKELIGCEAFKKQVCMMVGTWIATGIVSGTLNPLEGHWCFLGPTGSGKTKCAEMVGQLRCALGGLVVGDVVKTKLSDLKASYEGQTEEKTTCHILSCLGSVMLVDGSHGLGNGSAYGDQVVTQMLTDLNLFKKHICVIFTGYKDKMAEMFMRHKGIRSRFCFHVTLTSYTNSQLARICWKQLSDHAEKTPQINLDPKHESRLKDTILTMMDKYPTVFKDETTLATENIAHHIVRLTVNRWWKNNFKSRRFSGRHLTGRLQVRR
jgi:ATPases of the AAA+ class